MTRANSCMLQISNSEALTDIHMTRTLESEVVDHLTFLAHRILMFLCEQYILWLI